MNKVLYYPYIEMPDHIWTINSVMYWDNIGTIYPEVVSKYLDEDDITKELITSDILIPITPADYDYNRDKILIDIKTVIENPAFNIDDKRSKLEDGFHTDCYAQKFEAEVFDFLVEQNLAIKKNSDAFIVEHHAANAIILLLATEIGRIGEFTPSTDDEHFLKPEFFNSASTFNVQNIRNEFLEEILPCPTNIELNKLLKFKGKYDSDLQEFRKEIELTVETLSKVTDAYDLPELKAKHLKRLEERKEFVTRKLNESNFDKILFGGWHSFFIGANITVATHDIAPVIIGSVNAGIGAAKKIMKDETKGHPLRYLGLLEKNFK